MYNSERSTPSVLLVLPETTNSTDASGASALDQVVSSVASASSPPPALPGSGPFTIDIDIATAERIHARSDNVKEVLNVLAAGIEVIATDNANRHARSGPGLYAGVVML